MVIFYLHDPEQVIGISSFLLSTALVQVVFNTFRWAVGNCRHNQYKTQTTKPYHFGRVLAFHRDGLQHERRAN